MGNYNMSLAKRTTVGVIWNFAETISKRGISIVITLLLARFLTPDDYGLIAMMSVFTTVASELMESGFRQALIRKSDATQVDFNTAFYTNIGLAILAYLALFASAPLISTFYGEPRLTLLIRVVGITILISSLQVVQSATLSRELKFKAQLQVTIPATIISGIIAVFMAYQGFGVWALIAQLIVSSIVTTFSIWSLKLWRPTREVSRESFNEMYGFGSKIFLSNLLSIVFQNIYVIVIAKIFAVTIAGQYFFARKIRDMTLNQFVNTIQVVTYPALATLQNDEVALKSGYRKIIKITTYLVFPGMSFLAVLAEPFFVLILNEKWIPAVPYLQLLCIGGLMYPLHSINLNMLQVKGRSDLVLYIGIFKKISTVSILYFTIKYGIIGILIGQIVDSVLSYIPNSYFSKKMINYPANEQISDFIPNLVLSGTIATAVYFAINTLVLPAYIELFLFGALAVIAYIGASYIFKLDACYITINIIKKALKKGHK
ncbi:lipopolysaccharide biosynthesis protein [Methanolobus sp.]|jgi:O-antigen/teichoic acid export membrane protein|uniref:lipopolysaccharide biosynthesis protein n=1 Tax=Methanolobus sp. TaxID=1874737 RepID=UPI0025FCDB49|nr:lipopolysaccharide biosynthesis protein [Methanolobus sp.]